MDSKFFDQVIDDQINHIRDVLAIKGKEYARGDRLSNFKIAGRRLGITPEMALMSFREKHEVSILDIVNDINEGMEPSVDVIDEKIGDSINYLILLKALLYERIGVSKKEDE